jgi:predicted  nucleic acid-binding Zn-ribbon protein
MDYGPYDCSVSFEKRLEQAKKHRMVDIEKEIQEIKKEIEKLKEEIKSLKGI